MYDNCQKKILASLNVLLLGILLCSLHFKIPQQAVIRLKPDGEYYVVNEGRRPIFVDGKPVLTDAKAKLHHNSTFEVSDI